MASNGYCLVIGCFGPRSLLSIDWAQGSCQTTPACQLRSWGKLGLFAHLESSTWISSRNHIHPSLSKRWLRGLTRHEIASNVVGILIIAGFQSPISRLSPIINTFEPWPTAILPRIDCPQYKSRFPMINHYILPMIKTSQSTSIMKQNIWPTHNDWPLRSPWGDLRHDQLYLPFAKHCHRNWSFWTGTPAEEMADYRSQLW